MGLFLGEFLQNSAHFKNEIVINGLPPTLQVRIRNDNSSGETRLSCVHSWSQQCHDRPRTKVEPMARDERIPKPEINSIHTQRTLKRQPTFATSPLPGPQPSSHAWKPQTPSTCTASCKQVSIFWEQTRRGCKTVWHGGTVTPLSHKARQG